MLWGRAFGCPLVRAIKRLLGGVLRNDLGVRGCFHGDFGLSYKNFVFLEKSACGSEPLTLEPPLPDEQRRSNGTPDGPDGSGDADRGRNGKKRNF